MIVFKVKLKDGSYLGINDDNTSTKDLFFKTTKKNAHKYYTEASAILGTKYARYKQYLGEHAYWATIEKEII